MSGPTLTLPRDGGVLCKGSRRIDLHHTDVAATFARVRAERAAQAEQARQRAEAEARTDNVFGMGWRRGGHR